MNKLTFSEAKAIIREVEVLVEVREQLKKFKKEDDKTKICLEMFLYWNDKKRRFDVTEDQFANIMTLLISGIGEEIAPFLEPSRLVYCLDKTIERDELEMSIIVEEITALISTLHTQPQIKQNVEH